MTIFYHVKFYTGIIVDGMIWHSPNYRWFALCCKAAISVRRAVCVGSWDRHL